MRDYGLVASKIYSFLQDYLTKSGASGFVLGVSGGLDSAVVAALCVKSDIKTNALIMPTKQSSKQNLTDGIEFCEQFKIAYKIIEIQPILDSFASQIGDELSRIRKGNLAARIRMSLLYDYSACKNLLVVGTSNKSERMLGYGTIYGDMACALNPIGELYKGEIFEFAKFLGISENIISKAPSADLWEGQSDEADIGYSYAKLDEVLDLVDKLSEDELKQKFECELVETVLARVGANKFKLISPPIARLN